MGLHRENNAVVQIHFLPSRVSPSAPIFQQGYLGDGEGVLRVGVVFEAAPWAPLHTLVWLRVPCPVSSSASW